MANYKRKRPNNVHKHNCTLSSFRCGEYETVVGNGRDRLPFRDLKKLPDWRYQKYGLIV